VLAIVAQAVLRVGRRALKTRASWVVAAVAFVALFALAVPFPAIILAAGFVGFLAPGSFRAAGHGVAGDAPDGLIDRVLRDDPGRPARQARGARRAGLLCAAAWLLTNLWFLAGRAGTYGDIAWFFSKMAVVTFGGAYAVLAYVAQGAVGTYHWLAPAEMLTGLGLAETTPGPLILVLQFVGFLAGARSTGAVHGLAGGVAGSALTLWVTFLPCFAFVFLGAPVVERLAENRALGAALAAVTAAVVGVIANLAVWFGLHVLFRQTVAVQAWPVRCDVPVLASVDWVALALAALGAGCLFRLRLPVPAVLGLAAGASLGWTLLAG